MDISSYRHDPWPHHRQTVARRRQSKTVARLYFPKLTHLVAYTRSWANVTQSAAIATALARQRTRQVDFLLRRAGSRAELLNVVRTSVLERAPLSVRRVLMLFCVINYY